MLLRQGPHRLHNRISSLQMDRASKAVETNNAKLAGVLKRVASTRNFCIDITLIIILLAVVGYIYTLLN